MIPLSVLDLVPITQGSDPGEALARSLELARHAERLGYRRYWVAEHHNMPGIASAATAVVIGHRMADKFAGPGHPRPVRDRIRRARRRHAFGLRKLKVNLGK